MSLKEECDEALKSMYLSLSCNNNLADGLFKTVLSYINSLEYALEYTKKLDSDYKRLKNFTKKARSFYAPEEFDRISYRAYADFDEVRDLLKD